MNGSNGPLPSDAGALIERAAEALRRGDLDEARRSLEEALRLYRDVRDLRGLVSAALALGAVARESADLSDASSQYRSALALSLEIGWDAGTLGALEGIREVALARGESMEAQAYENQIQDMRRLMGGRDDPPAGED